MNMFNQALDDISDDISDEVRRKVAAQVLERARAKRWPADVPRMTTNYISLRSQKRRALRRKGVFTEEQIEQMVDWQYPRPQKPGDRGAKEG